MSKKLNRRDFIKSTTASTAGVATIPLLASGIWRNFLLFKTLKTDQ
jgi:hypothetical protein